MTSVDLIIGSYDPSFDPDGKTAEIAVGVLESLGRKSDDRLKPVEKSWQAGLGMVGAGTKWMFLR